MHTRIVLWIVGFLLVLSSASAEGAPDADGSKAMLANARKLLRSKDPSDRAEAIELLVKADSRKSIQPLEDAIRRSRRDMDKLAKELDRLDTEYVNALYSLILAKRSGDSSRLHWANQAVERTRAAWQAAAAIMRGHLIVTVDVGWAMLRFRSPGAVAKIESGARSESDALIRQMYIRALGHVGRTSSVETLLGILKSSDPRVRSMAATALRNYILRDGVLEALEAQIEDRCWSVRRAVYESLARGPMERAVEALVGAIKNEKGQMAYTVDSLLDALVGVTFGGDSRAWAKWWADEAESIKNGTYQHPAVRNSARDAGGTVSTFFTIPIVSENVLFVVDMSSSMDEEFQVNDSGMKAEVERAGLSHSRRGYAITQFEKALRELPDGARFNVVAFGDESERMSSSPVRVSKGSRTRASKWLRKRGRMWATNTWSALREAFGDHLGGSGGRRKFTHLADTIIFLSDGVATRGRFQEDDELAVLVGMWNASAGAVIHAVGIGDSHSAGLLEKLASKTNGLYVSLASGDASLKRHPHTVPSNERGPYFARDIKSILKRLKSDDWEVRLAALKDVRSLGPWGAPALRFIGKAIADDDSDVAEAAADALVSLGKISVPLASARLKEADSDLVLLGLRVLRGLGADAAPAVPEIQRILARDDFSIRLDALRTLDAIGPAAIAAVEDVRRLVTCDDDELKRAAERALASIEGT